MLEQFGFPVAEAVYEVPIDVGLLWKSWDDGTECVVFHSGSGQTHLLDELAAWVVKLLQNQSLSAATISERIGTEFGPELETSEIEQYVSALLPRLCQLGLVGASNSCS